MPDKWLKTTDLPVFGLPARATTRAPLGIWIGPVVCLCTAGFHLDTGCRLSAQCDFYIALTNYDGASGDFESTRQLRALGDAQTQQLGTYQTFWDLQHLDRVAPVGFS